MDVHVQTELEEGPFAIRKRYRKELQDRRASVTLRCANERDGGLCVVAVHTLSLGNSAQIERDVPRLGKNPVSFTLCFRENLKSEVGRAKIVGHGGSCQLPAEAT